MPDYSCRTSGFGRLGKNCTRPRSAPATRPISRHVECTGRAGGVEDGELSKDLFGELAVPVNPRMNALVLQPRQEVFLVGLGLLPVGPVIDERALRLGGDV